MRGFTLLELMLVMLIVGIVLSLAVVSLPRNDAERQLEQEAERLHAILRLAQDEAILRGTPIGLRAATHGYDFLSLVEGAWSPILEGPLRPRTLSPELTLYVRTEADRAASGPPASASKAPEAPVILLWPSGEHTPFRLQLEHASVPAMAGIGADELGRLVLESGR